MDARLGAVRCFLSVDPCPQRGGRQYQVRALFLPILPLRHLPHINRKPAQAFRPRSLGTVNAINIRHLATLRKAWALHNIGQLVLVP